MSWNLKAEYPKSIFKRKKHKFYNFKKPLLNKAEYDFLLFDLKKNKIDFDFITSEINCNELQNPQHSTSTPKTNIQPKNLNI